MGSGRGFRFPTGHRPPPRDDSAESQPAEDRLREVCGLDADDPSFNRTEWVERAYDIQAARIAYAAGGGQ